MKLKFWKKENKEEKYDNTPFEKAWKFLTFQDRLDSIANIEVVAEEENRLAKAFSELIALQKWFILSSHGGGIGDNAPLKKKDLIKLSKLYLKYSLSIYKYGEDHPYTNAIRTLLLTKISKLLTRSIRSEDLKTNVVLIPMGKPEKVEKLPTTLQAPMDFETKLEQDKVKKK